MDNIKKESTLAGIVGVQQPGQQMVKKKFTLDPEILEKIVADAVLHGRKLKEVVRKKGSLYALYDDDSERLVASFKKRSDAWKKQRMRRQHVKLQKQQNKKKKGEEKKHKELTKHMLGPKAFHPKKPKKNVRESLRDAFVKVLLKESSGGVLSYIFETPTNTASVEWDNFLRTVSKEAILADPKLKQVVGSMMKAEGSILKKAGNIVKAELQKAGFEVRNFKMGSDNEENRVRIDFDVISKQDKKTFSFGIKIDNGRPLVLIPDETRNELNALNSPGTKLLRSTLISTQEIELDKLEALVKSTGKRDQYLASLEGQIDSMINDLGPLELAMVKRLLKTKYKNVS